MRHEARFSVIFPAGSLSTAQVGEFEKTCHRYGLAVNLPLRNDGFGNIVASSGLSLQDAQMLRRQISGLGYNVDVLNDKSDEQSFQAASPSPDTRVVGADRFSGQEHDSIADITSDAWMSLEMEPLDLGLSDGGQLSDSPSFTGENWLKPDLSSQTLSVSAKDLYDVLKASSSQELERVSADGRTSSSEDLEAVLPDDTVSSKRDDVDTAADRKDKARPKASAAETSSKNKARTEDKTKHAPTASSIEDLEAVQSSPKQIQKPAFVALLWIALAVVILSWIIVAFSFVSSSPIIDTLLMPIK